MKKTYFHLFLNIIVVIITLFTASYTTIYYDNFTSLATNHFPILLLWSNVCCIITLYLLYDISKLTLNNKHKKYYLIIIYIFQLLTTLFNFDKSSIFQLLHLIFAYAFFLSINFYFIYLNYQFSLRNNIVSTKLNQYYYAILAICMFIFMYFMSINTLFEIVFTILFSFFLTYCFYIINKH